jgi:hypothetical protein
MSPDPVVQYVEEGKLLGQKLLIAFLVGFLPIFSLTVTQALDAVVDAISTGGDVDFNFLKALLLSGLMGAASAGFRLALAKLPFLNLTATDKLHSFGSPPPIEVRAQKTP